MDTVNCINHQVIHSPSESVIWSISISADDKLLAVGQTAGQDGKPTLSLIEIADKRIVGRKNVSQNTDPLSPAVIPPWTAVLEPSWFWPVKGITTILRGEQNQRD